MTTHPHSLPENETISCEVCLKEIPLSESARFEAEDYVAHFCGLECFATWKQRSEAEKQRNKKS